MPQQVLPVLLIHAHHVCAIVQRHRVRLLHQVLVLLLSRPVYSYLHLYLYLYVYMYVYMCV